MKQKLVDVGLCKYIETQRSKNDWMWFLVIVIICIMFGGQIIQERLYCETKIKVNRKVAEQFYLNQFNNYTDSVIVYCDAEYNVAKRWKNTHAE